jgi:hypothetical protein
MLAPGCAGGREEIFTVVVVVRLGGVIYGCYTVSGRGIEQHPHDGWAAPPAPRAPGEASGRGVRSDLDDHAGMEAP